jgi:hypothetical protein
VIVLSCAIISSLLAGMHCLAVCSNAWRPPSPAIASA